MKLLVVLSIVGYCLAMPTPTNNSTETLYRLMEKMKDRLFSAHCVTENPTNDATMTMWTQPMECMWPKMHNMSASIDEWVTMMGNTGCTVPQEGMLKMLRRVMAQRHYEDSPIIRKFPNTQCGMCGRKIQCCPATQFLVQSYKSTACESAPCQVEPMTVENWNYVREKYPEWNLPTTNEPCNFGVLMRESMMTSKVFPFMRIMYMQMVGAEMPTMNCQTVENMCACCCSGFVHKEGKCVADETMQTTPMMSEMTTTTMNAETSIMTETMVDGTTTMPIEGTTMPVVEITTVMEMTTVRPVAVSTTPKTLFNEDDGKEGEDDDDADDDKRKRRSAEEEDEDSSEEKEVEELAEKVAEEIISHEGEGGAEDLVAEVIAEEIEEEKKEEDCTTLEPEILTTNEALTEAATIMPIEETTMLPIEETTMLPFEETTMMASEAWTEGTTVVLQLNETITKATNLEIVEIPTPIPAKIETLADTKEMEKPLEPPKEKEE